MSVMFRSLLIVLLIVEIGKCAPDMCETKNHPGYRCEGYGCYKTGNCSIGHRQGVVGDPTFSCKVGRLNYWEEFSRTLPPTQECPGRRCDPSLLSRISVEEFDGYPSVSVMFTVPPASAKYHYYPSALSMKVDIIKSPSGGDRHRSVRLFSFESGRYLERYLLFPCILQDERNSLNILEFKVFSWKSSINTEAENLTKTSVYNVTVFPVNLRLKDKIRTIAVARYPTDNDLHVVFDKVTSPGVKSYKVKVVDKRTGRQWGRTVTVYHESGNYSCTFYGIHGQIQIEIEIEHQDKSVSGPFISHPVFFKDISSPEDDPIHGESSSVSTVAYSATSAVVISSCLVALLYYCRRKKSKESHKHHVDNPNVLLIYSNKRKENVSLAITFANFLRSTLNGASVTFEGDEKEQSSLHESVPLWYQRKIRWASHVIVMWFPGAMDDKDDVNAHQPIQHHFPTTLCSLLNQNNTEKKFILCVYFEKFTEKSSITTMLKDHPKFCLPREFENFYYKIMGRKCPNNLPYNQMDKIRQTFPDLWKSVKKAGAIYRPDLVEYESESSECEEPDDNKKTQTVESFIGGICLDIDPNCPIHGLKMSKGEENRLVDNPKEEIDFSKRSCPGNEEFEAPSDDDTTSISSSKMEEAMLSLNGMGLNKHDEPEGVPLLATSSVSRQSQTPQVERRTFSRECNGRQELNTEEHESSALTPDNHEMQPLINDLSHARLRENQHSVEIPPTYHLQYSPAGQHYPSSHCSNHSVSTQYNTLEDTRIHSLGHWPHHAISDVHQGYNNVHTLQHDNVCMYHHSVRDPRELANFQNYNVPGQQGYPIPSSTRDVYEQNCNPCCSSLQQERNADVVIYQRTRNSREGCETGDAFISDDEWHDMCWEEEMKHLNGRP